MHYELGKRSDPPEFLKGNAWRNDEREVVAGTPLHNIGRQKMKTGRIALAVGVIVAGAAFASAAFAQPSFPTVTRNYNVWMARAMDQCSPSGLTVQGVSGVGACIQANVATDSLMTMNSARLVVNRRTGKLIVTGHGMTPGGRVLVQLVLRTTRNGLTVKHPPLSNQRATFVDTTIQCPGMAPFGFTVRSNGVLSGQDTLVNCLGPAQAGLASGNIEIIDAALLNHDNGDKVFAHPGLLR